MRCEKKLERSREWGKWPWTFFCSRKIVFRWHILVKAKSEPLESQLAQINSYAVEPVPKIS